MENFKKKIVAATRPRDKKGRFIKDKKKYAASTWIADDLDPFAQDNLPIGVAPFAPGLKHANIFRGVSAVPSKIYRNLDEALKNNRNNARAMRYDMAILEPLFARQIAIAQLEDHVESDKENKLIAEDITNLLKKTPRWTELKRNLADAIYFGKMAIALNYGWEWIKGQKKLVVKSWIPIIGDKLVFRNNDQELGYLVHTPTGLREVAYTDIGRCEIFNSTDLESLIVHKHFIIDSPAEEPELAILTHGCGIRHFLYWTWFCKQELLGWLFNCFERYGAGGIQIWYFEHGNPRSEAAVREAAEVQSNNNILLFPRPIGTEKQGPGIEIVKPDGAGIEWFHKFIDEYFNGQIRRFILGSDVKNIDKDNADLIKSDFTRLIKYDAENLSETITKQFVKTLVKYNYPGQDIEIKYSIAVDKPDPQKFLEAAQRAYEMGIALNAQQIRDIVGLSVPEEHHEVIKKPQYEDQTIKMPEKNIGNFGEQLS